MQNERFSREEFLAMFTEDVIRLSKYIPWLEAKSGADVSKSYEDGDKMKHTLSFPVYDSILLAFLNDASTTVFMNKNYQYFYTRNHIKDYEDELRMIAKADIMHMDILQDILSRYVFGGMVKAYLWKDGVEHRIFVSVLQKAREIVEFWSEPLIIEDEIPAEGYPEEFKYPEVDEADWTDEEFAAVLAGELDPDDIPRLRYEKEHGVVSEDTGAVPEVVLPEGYEFPPVDDEDWTDEEFSAVLAGELDPDDIPRLRYEKENGVKVVFAPADSVNADADDTSGDVTEISEVVLPADYEFPAVDDEDWTDEEFSAVLAGELDPNDIPRLRYEKENGVKVVFAPVEETVEEPMVEETVKEPMVEETVTEEVAAEETVVEEPEAEEVAVEETVVEEPVTEEVAEETVVEEPEAEEVAEETVVEEPEAEEVAVEETVVEEVAAEETVVEELVTEEVAAEETVVEEPVVEEVATEEAVVEEPVVEKPKKKRQRKQKRSQE